MIYSNQSFSVQDIPLANSTIKGFCLAVDQNGKRLILPTVKSLTEIPAERSLKDYTLGRTQTNRPRVDQIKPNDDGAVYLILSAKGLDYGSGNGRIMAPNGYHYDLIDRRDHYDEYAGLNYTVAIIRAKEGNIFRVVPSGYANNSEISSSFYIIHDGKVFYAAQPDISTVYSGMGLPVPQLFGYHQKNGQSNSRGRLIIEKQKWHRL